MIGYLDSTNVLMTMPMHGAVLTVIENLASSVSNAEDLIFLHMQSLISNHHGEMAERIRLTEVTFAKGANQDVNVEEEHNHNQKKRTHFKSFSKHNF